jgi:glycosyltransferase involved in cell wall biosynthesis
MAEKTSRFVDRLEQPDLCGIATDRLGQSIMFDQLLPAVDLVLLTAGRPVATLPIAICMAAALPIVAVASSTVNELLTDRHNALLVSTPSPRAIAQRVLHIQQDSNLRSAIGDTARTRSHEHFSKTRFVKQLCELYRQVDNGEVVEVTAPVAGARFQTVS